MRSRLSRRAFLLLLFVVACGGRDAIGARAAELVAEARAVEPEVTPVLVGVAKEMGGKMIKLEHRLKTLDSTKRKLHKMLADEPQPIERMRLDDSLRYTIAFDDSPQGHYMDAASETLRRLEARGHRVTFVKNYWPRRDSYSGMHAILRAPSGLVWELQFHTPPSLEVQARTRDWYEELRAETTPIARKRELFDRMSRAWDEVPIPAGALDRARNHRNAEIIRRPAP